MTATPTSRGKDRTVSPGSEPDSAPETPSDSAASVEESSASTKSGGGKKTSPAGQKRDEVVVQVPPPAEDDDAETTSDVRVAGKSPSPSSDTTVTDLGVVTPEETSASSTEPAADQG